MLLCADSMHQPPNPNDSASAAAAARMSPRLQKLIKEEEVTIPTTGSRSYSLPTAKGLSPLVSLASSKLSWDRESTTSTSTFRRRLVAG